MVYNVRMVLYFTRSWAGRPSPCRLSPRLMRRSKSSSCWNHSRNTVECYPPLRLPRYLITCTYTYIHTRTHIDTVYKHIHIYACIHTYIHSKLKRYRTSSYSTVHIYVYIRICMHAYMHSCIHTHIRPSIPI
jgi:hypothetical protein